MAGPVTEAIASAGQCQCKNTAACYCQHGGQLLPLHTFHATAAATLAYYGRYSHPGCCHCHTGRHHSRYSGPHTSYSHYSRPHTSYSHYSGPHTSYSHYSGPHTSCQLQTYTLHGSTPLLPRPYRQQYTTLKRYTRTCHPFAHTQLKP